MTAGSRTFAEGQQSDRSLTKNTPGATVAVGDPAQIIRYFDTSRYAVNQKAYLKNNKRLRACRAEALVFA